MLLNILKYLLRMIILKSQFINVKIMQNVWHLKEQFHEEILYNKSNL